MNEIESSLEIESSSLIKEGGVYLITGGLGELGMIFANYLIKRAKARLVLTGRSNLDEENRSKLKTLEMTGADILYVKSDVSNLKDVKELVAKAKAKYRKIDGVIHSAGIIRDAFVLKKNEDEINAVLAAKVFGTKHLDEVLKDEPLDFFVLFSSVTAVLGNIGQSDYGYANSYMDYFAQWRDAQCKSGNRFGKTLSINWPLWKEGKMNINDEKLTMIKDGIGMLPLSKEEGIPAFERGLQLSGAQMLVINGKGDEIRTALKAHQDQKAMSSYESQNGIVTDREECLTSDGEKDVLNQTENYLKDLVSNETKIAKKKIRSDESFGKYGIESVAIMKMTKSMEEKLGELSKTLFFEYENIKELAYYLVENKRDALLNLFGKISEDSLVKIKDYESVKSKKKEIASSSRLPLRKSEKTAKREVDFHDEDVAIIGVAGKYPIAENIDEFWENLKAGKDCITEIPDNRWDHSLYYDPEKGKLGKTYSKWGGFISDVEMFDSLFFSIPPIEAEFLDPQERLFLEITWKAIEDAGYSRSTLKKEKVGVFVGAMYGLYQLFETEAYGKKISGGSSFASIANRVSYFFDFHGPSIALDTMCSSSLTTIHLGCDSIRKGESDMVIAGGVNLSLHPNKYIQLSQGNFISTDGRCRSFGQDGDGYVPGEGVGAIVLKALDRAIQDGDNIYAVIKGSSINSGGRTSGYTVPNLNAQGELIKDVLKKTKINPRTISYIEAHGTGTVLGDPIEIKGLSKAFGEYTNEHQYCSIGSAKANIGHLESAAGIAAITKVILQMKHKQLVPSIHSEPVNSYIDFKNTPFYVQHTLEKWEQPVVTIDKGRKRYPRRAGISAFGAGGANAHIIIEEYEEPVSSVPNAKDTPKLIILSAKNKERLKIYAERLNTFLDKYVFNNSNNILSEVNLTESYDNSEYVRKQVIQSVSDILCIPKNEVTDDEIFIDLGFDPYSLMLLREQLQRKLEVDIPLNVMIEYSTVNQLVQYLASYHIVDLSTKLEPELKLSLDDLAFTLQIGRECMEERLAIIASNINDLQKGLTDYCSEKHDNPNLKNGNINDYREKFDILLTGEIGNGYMEKFLKERDLVKIAELWVMGATTEWEILYKNQKRRRISLPTYPFAKERHWIIPQGNDKRLVPSLENSRVSVVSEYNTSQIQSESPMLEKRYTINPDGESINDEELEEAILDYLKQAFSTVLKIPVKYLSLTADFETYGIDSIHISRLNKYFEKLFDKLPSTLLFTYKNLKSLSRYFVKQQREKSIIAISTIDNKEYVENYFRQVKNENTTFEAIKMQKSVEEDTSESETGIAIIGISGVFPQAGSLEEFMKNLKYGKDCITKIPKERWDYKQYPDIACKWGGFIDDVDKFDPQFFNIAPINASFMDPQERLFIQTVWSCLEDAGYTPEALSDPTAGDQRGNVAVYAGVTFNTYGLLGVAEMEKGNMFPLNSQIYSVANRISYLLNLRGPSMSVDTACSSSLYAIHLGCESLLRNECEMAIAGGVNLSLHPSKYITLDLAKFLATDGHCRSFGEGGDGYVPAEGVGAVLLKPLGKAKRDRDHIYGVIKGSAVNHGGKTHGYSVPNPVAQTEVIKKALEKARINPRTISYIEAHGTGTSLGDPIEIAALTDAFSEYTSAKQYCSIGSVKSNIGHLEAAAGISQVIKVLLQLKYKILFPSLLNAERTNSNIDFANTPFHVQMKAEKWEKIVIDGEKKIECPRRAGISSFGVGGVNVHLIIEEYQDEIKHQQQKSDVAVLIPLSAKSENGLKKYVTKLKIYFESILAGKIDDKISEQKMKTELPDLRDVAFTLQTGRIALPYRVAFVTSGYEHLIRQLESYLRLDEIKSIKSMNGIFSGKAVSTINRIKQENHQMSNNKLTTESRIFELAEQWVQGQAIHFNEFYADYFPCRVSLPVYPFEKERYWLYNSHKESSTTEKNSLSMGEVSFVREEVAEFRDQEANTIASVNFNITNNTISDSINSVENKESECVDMEFLYQLADSLESEHLEMMIKYIQKIFASLLGFTEGRLPDVEQGFFELGLESVATAQAYNLLEKRFNLELDEQIFFNYPNITEVSQYMLLLINLDDLEIISEIYETNDAQDLSTSICSVKNDKLVHADKNMADSISTLYFESILETADSENLKNSSETKLSGNILLFDVDIKLRNELQTQMVNKNTDIIILVKPGKKYKALGNNIFVINPSEIDDYRNLFAELKLQKLIPNKIIHYWSSDESAIEQKQIDEKLERGIYSMFTLSQLIMEMNPKRKVQLLYVYNGEDKLVESENGAMSGFLRNMYMENSLCTYKTVELMTSNMSTFRISEILREELLDEEYEIEVCRSGQQRFIRKIKATERKKEYTTDNLIKDNGVYLIIGGLGKIGMLFARYLSKTVKSGIALIDCREMNEEDLNNAKNIEVDDSEIFYIRADVSKREDVEVAISKTKAKFNKIDGVFYAIDATKDSYIRNVSTAEIIAEAVNKVYGIRYIDEILKEEELDFFAMFSSTVSNGDNIEQCKDVFANSYMTLFAEKREKLRVDGKRYGKTFSINCSFTAEQVIDIDFESKNCMIYNIILKKEDNINQLLNDSKYIMDNERIEDSKTMTLTTNKIENLSELELIKSDEISNLLSEELNCLSEVILSEEFDNMSEDELIAKLQQEIEGKIDLFTEV